MQSNNKNKILCDIEEGKGEDRYKDCTHLVPGVSSGEHSFYTSCDRYGLEYSGDSSVPQSTLGVQLPPRCPTDCHFFPSISRQMGRNC